MTQQQQMEVLEEEESEPESDYQENSEFLKQYFVENMFNCMSKFLNPNVIKL